MDKLPITKAGEQELAERLRQLKTKDRPEISQAIQKLALMEILKKMLSIMLQKNNKVLSRQKYKK